jgi:hypothetical protein
MEPMPKSYRAAAKYVQCRERVGDCMRGRNTDCPRCLTRLSCDLVRDYRRADRVLGIANGKA